MELREFIKTSLVDIIRGIQDGLEEIRDDQDALGAVNPVMKSQVFRTEKVEFDIAVTASSEDSKGGKAGISVYGLGAGAEGKKTKADSTVSRLKFNVPVAPPSLVIKDSL